MPGATSRALAVRDSWELNRLSWLELVTGKKANDSNSLHKHRKTIATRNQDVEETQHVSTIQLVQVLRAGEVGCQWKRITISSTRTLGKSLTACFCR